MKLHVTTTITKENHQLCKEKGIKFAEALDVGIKTLLCEPVALQEGQIVVHESEIAKKERALGTLNAHIEKLNEELEELKHDRKKGLAENSPMGNNGLFLGD